MSIMEESWTGIPDLAGYEISTCGRIRSWVYKNGQVFPYIHEGRRLRDEVVYDLPGGSQSVDDLMRYVYEIEDYDLGHVPGERDRDLTTYELREIILQEGLKPAYEVAAEFRIETSRVRSIWDGGERC